MRRSETASRYSQRAYYFGVLSLVLLFTERGIAWTLTVPGNRLPTSLVWLTLCLAVISASLCTTYAIKGRKEPSSVKKGISRLLAFIVILFMVYVLYQRLTA